MNPPQMISHANRDPDVQRRLDALQAKIPWNDDVARLEDGFMHYGRFTDTVRTPEANHLPGQSVTARAYEHVFGHIELSYFVAENGSPEDPGHIGVHRKYFGNRGELDSFLEGLVGPDPKNSEGTEAAFEWRDLYDDLHALADRQHR